MKVKYFFKVAYNEIFLQENIVYTDNINFLHHYLITNYHA